MSAKHRLFKTAIILAILIAIVAISSKALAITAEICWDNENGQNYYLKGYVYRSNETTMYSWDSCLDRNTVVENYCGFDAGSQVLNHLKTVEFACPNGCNDGACTGTVIDTCVDSDGGQDYYVLGMVDAGRMGYQWDYCIDSNTLIEQGCANNSNGPIANYGQTSQYVCPNGCNAGVCIPGSVTSPTPTPGVSPAVPTLSSIKVISPNGGETFNNDEYATISWSMDKIIGPTNTYEVWLYKGGEKQTKIGVFTDKLLIATTNGVAWDLTALLPGSDYKIRIVSVDYPNIYDESDNYFSVVNHISSTHPNNMPLEDSDSFKYTKSACVHKNPTYVTSVPEQTGYMGEAKAYTFPVTVTNNDSLECAPILFSFYSEVQNGMISRMDYTAATLPTVAPGKSLSFNVYVGVNFNYLGPSSIPVPGVNNIWFQTIYSANNINYSAKIAAKIILLSRSAIQIKVISPNGGEIIKKGSTYEIKWSTTNTDKNAKVLISLSSKNGNVFDPIAKDVSQSLGKYSWSIPGDFGGASGSREETSAVKIAVMDTINYIFDESDNYFTIGDSAVSNPIPAPTPTLIPASGCLPDNTLIKLPNDPKVYVIINCEKKWIQTIEEFQKNNYSWSDVKEDTTGTIDTLPNYAGAVNDNLVADGSIIQVTGDPDVYIVKEVGSKKFKRLILSPSVFKSYGHLKWSNIIKVDKSILDSYTVSTLVRSAATGKIYSLIPNGDVGTRRLIKDDSTLQELGFDPLSVYEINATDENSYIQGEEIQ